MIDFIGVGSEKSGSSWLYKCLLEHPHICGLTGKEVMFFDTTKILGKPPREKSDYELYGISRYEKKFTHCPADSVKGEFTTTYLHDKAVARRIYENFPNVKILINLRDPIEKCFAMYIGAKENHGYTSFEEALANEPEFMRRSMYSEYVEEYLKIFPRENILITFHEDMVKNPSEFIRRIYSFLGVDENFIPPSLSIKIDSEKHKLLTAVRNSMVKVTLFRHVLNIARKTRTNGLAKKIFSLFIRVPKVKEETRKKLERTFSSDIDHLEKLIGRNLDMWRE